MNHELSGSVPERKTYKLICAALMCAIIAILSQIAIPMPSGVPITLQTFAVALCGCILEIRYSLASVAVYLLLGLVGVPVFSGLQAGPGRLFGPTGGFLWGFLLFVLFCSLSLKLQDQSKSRFRTRILQIVLCLIGLIVCHICGVLQYSFVTKNGIIPSFVLVSFPYLIKDIASVVLAILISDRIRPILARF